MTKLTLTDDNHQVIDDTGRLIIHRQHGWDGADIEIVRAMVESYNALAGLNPEGVAEAVKALEWAMTHVENVFALAGRHDRERPQLEAARCALAAVRQP